LEDRLAPAQLVYDVTSTLDDGNPGTLRDAILQTNANANAPGVNDLIHLDLTNPVAGQPATILLATALPVITDPVTIDVTGNSAVILQGNLGINGLVFGSTDSSSSSGSQLSGSGAASATTLSIVGCDKGVVLQTNDNTVTGIRVGLGDAGQAWGNNIGIEITGQNNTIGSTAAGGANVVSSNSLLGIQINGVYARNNLVQANHIGTDVAGTAARANGYDGVSISQGAQLNTVGGTGFQEGNLLSGNGRYGLGIYGSETQQNLVEGNLVGVDATNAVALPNGTSSVGDGVAVYGGANHNTIGGGAAGASNVLAGNGRFGVSLSGSGTSDNQILGNEIGVTGPSGGGKKVANFFDGVAIFSGASGNTVGSTLGPPPGGSNIISGNGRFGVFLFNGATRNQIAGNYIGTDDASTPGLGNLFDGVAVTGSTNNTIGGTGGSQGNVIAANNRFGVYLFDDGGSASNNQVCGNFLGMDAQGATLGLGNGVDGVSIYGGTLNTIGGVNAAAQNVISNNGVFGVQMAGKTTFGNTLLNNYIGLAPDGTTAAPNAVDGVAVLSGASGNIIREGNVISGNRSTGILFNGASNNVVQGSLIGLNASGTGAVPNGLDGIQIQAGAANNLIGGITTEARNVISGNLRHGILIRDKGTTGNTIQGNTIGLTADGTLGQGNNGDGIAIIAQGSHNVIGGQGSGAANVIGSNSLAGVLVGTDSTIPGGSVSGGLGNLILGNSILTNDRAGIGALGIALGTPTSIAANDPLDLDTGPNGLQDRPTLLAAIRDNGVLTVVFNLFSAPNTNYRIEFFTNVGPGATGEVYLGAVNVRTDAFGNLPLNVSMTTLADQGGVFMTATATDMADDGTSEFSDPIAIRVADSGQSGGT
jgi:hypothetical protein